MKKRLIALMVVLALLPLTPARAAEVGFAELKQEGIYACIGTDQTLTIESYVSLGGRGGYCQALYEAGITGSESKEELDAMALELVNSGAEPVWGGGKHCYHGGSYTADPSFTMKAGAWKPGTYVYVCYAFGCSGGSYSHELMPCYDRISTMGIRVTEGGQTEITYALEDSEGKVLAAFSGGDTVVADLNWGSVKLSIRTEGEHPTERVCAVEAQSEAFAFEAEELVLVPGVCGSGTLQFTIEGYADGVEPRVETVQIEYPCAPKGELTVLQENTCEEDGLAAYLCHGYGVSCETLFDEQVLHAKGHELFSVSQIVEKPKATLPGLGMGTCRVCGMIGVEQEIPAVFQDVEADAFYSRALDYCYDKAWVSGVRADAFAPGNNCQRAQVVTFLWRAAGKPAPEGEENPFVDVQVGSYYYQAVLWAAQNGITAGTDASHFSPGQVCSRAQVVTFLHRAFGTPEAEQTQHPFADVNQSSFYYDAMLWAVEEGITAGVTASAFAPGRECTRAQIVTFLYRAYAE